MMKHLALLVLSALLSVGCASVDTKPETSPYEDAVRIKPEAAHRYVQLASNSANRDGRTLRGVVSHVLIMKDTSGVPVDTVWAYRDKYDSTLSETRIAIPLRDIELIPTIFPEIKTGPYGGINLVESYHVTKNIPTIRELPVELSDAPKKDCNCEPFSISMAMGIKLSCYDRAYTRFAASVLGRASMYTDGNTVLQAGKVAYGGDIIAGYRFGEDMRWMLGLTFSSGLPTVNAGQITPDLTTLNDLAATTRPLGFITGRYYFMPLKQSEALKERKRDYLYIDASIGEQKLTPAEEELRRLRSNDSWFKAVFGCIKPYMYGELGMALDAATTGAASLSLGGVQCSECTVKLQDAKANGSLDLDWSMPISFGLGVGINIPIAPFLDLEIDLGYRNIAVADGYNLLGFTNVPDVRRMDSFQLRFGVMY
ncbi:MAG TPA: hypothetical protein DCZ59_09060 [Bacteroidetes bacterium]|nr:hypothetical protein [Bacteroidota bacterium]